MLKLVNVKKDYLLKDQEPVHALKGISLNFRRNEFVAILGPSGCGKTTLLNITGGLDHYTDGDLLIEGKSTKDYKDNDWDTYRNHSVGFVFQSYNLISHQSILKNVELSLTISGVDKNERKQRAIEALEKVGLKGLEKKKPNQLSGGQMQRVAIARALVNNPEIVLADEPTGALDSETSIQIMDLLKEVAKDRLVIMVTHNPDLAEKYATRIVTMFDGNITGDTNPYKGESEAKRAKALENKKVSKGNKKQTSMSFFTALGLSTSNLLSKLKRTTLVAIAGSIGIIGVSSVLSVSFGVTNYINSMQDDMLSSYPITVSEQSIDYSSLMEGLSNWDKAKLADFDITTRVGVDSMITYLMDKYEDLTQVKTNDINKDWLTYIEGAPKEAVSSLNYDYGIDPTNNIFTTWKQNSNAENEIYSLNGLTQRYVASLNTVEGFSKYAQFMNLFTDFMRQIPGDKDYIVGKDGEEGQYDIIAGEYTDKEDEIMLVVDSNTTLTDIVLGQLGFFTEEEFINIAKKALAESKGEKIDPEQYPYPTSFKYEDLLNKELIYYPHDSIWNYSEVYKVDYVETSATISSATKGENFILQYDITTGALTGVFIKLMPASYASVSFTKSTTETATNPLVGTWKGTVNETPYEIVIGEGNTISVNGDSTSYVLNVTSTPRTYSVNGYNYTAKVPSSWATDASKNGVKLKIKGILRPNKNTKFGCLSRGVYYTKAFTSKYIKDSQNAKILTDNDHGFYKYVGTDSEKNSPFMAYVTFNYNDYSSSTVKEKSSFASALNSGSESLSSYFSTSGSVDYHEVDKTFMRRLSGLSTKTCSSETAIHTTTVVKEDGTTTTYSFEDLPNSIEIYPPDFAAKDQVTTYLTKWNQDGNITLSNGKTLTKAERSEMSYTDTISLIISVVNSLIRIVTIALVAFTSLSLVVSCFMIAVITYISVMERVKEIGVIRSLGGRKKDVSRLFIAENLITGLASGIIGVAFTYLLSVCLNAGVVVFGVSNIANLPFYIAILMVVISILLSVLSGLIPSMRASRQDPVIALRSE